MLLRELFEDGGNDVAIIFGRFNPPHFGHKAAWETAAQFDNWYVGTNQSTVGPKDPLPFEVKIEAMKTIMPEIEGHLVPEQTWFTLAAAVYKKHGPDAVLHIVTDSEDAQIFYLAIKKQNGIEGPHGFYKFKDIVWAEAKRLSKATNLRQAIVDDDPEAFARSAGVPADTQVAGEPFFELVKKYMTPYMQAAAEKERAKAEKERLKSEKERAKAEKDKKKQPLSVATENFADGRNPQDKGDSKRHGVPTKASVSTLRQVAKQGGRKGQLAHWMANMKAGKKKNG
jgi:nicotinamide mononucleotide adenylyltransferase